MRHGKKSQYRNSLIRMLFSIAAIVACGNWAIARESSGEFDAPVLLRSLDGELIDSKRWSIPTVADIDGDGKNDVVVGQFMNHNAPWLRKPGGSGCSGTARWYRNESKSGALPTYAPGVDLEAEGGLLYAANW